VVDVVVEDISEVAAEVLLAITEVVSVVVEDISKVVAVVLRTLQRW
jgi:phenylpyruvate tautomerase PptA (4-oxalocrotonate tautomerase family)